MERAEEGKRLTIKRRAELKVCGEERDEKGEKN